MSIHPVKLSDWFPVGDEHYEICVSIIACSRCMACDKKLRYSKAIGHHSVPWGYGDLWCSWRCCYSGRTAKPDRRRMRRLKRKYKKEYEIFLEMGQNANK